MNNNPKIIQPKDVVFEENTVRTDIVPPPKSLPSKKEVPKMPWRTENMMHMVEKITPILSSVDNRSTGRAMQLKFGSERALLPYVVRIVPDERIYMQIGLMGCPSEAVKTYLFGQYGEQLAQSGILKAAGLSRFKTVTLGKISKYIPELESIIALQRTHVRTTTNPWLPLLALPIPDREFFAGVLWEMEKKTKWQVNNSEEYFKPIKLKEVFAYAEKVGEIKKVHHYMEIYSGVK